MIYKEEKEKWFQEQLNRIQSLKKEHVETKDILTSITDTLEKDILVHHLILFLI